ncbi:MAG: mechanosensitive ion channel domain-containing protein [Gemmatimonadaceae bacterium]
MDRLSTLLTDLREALDVTLLSIGQTTITLWNVLYLLVLALLLIWGSGLMRMLMVRALRRTGKVDAGVSESVGSIVRYAVVIIGFLMIVQTAGINLTTLNVLAGAVGLGVGFGLQNIASNFISGIILLIGRPIKLGDRIEVAGVEGDVVELGARATTVLTNDNISIIVPNSLFVSETVINWSLRDRRIRFRIPVAVAYGTDLRKAEEALIEVARNDPDVLDEPPPAVRFMEFGDSGLKLELRAWTDSLIHRRGLLVSRLNFGIYDAFHRVGIEVPFPQRVVHLRETPAAE